MHLGRIFQDCFSCSSICANSSCKWILNSFFSRADPSSVGVASDYGLRQNVARAHQEDQLLYQTERWHDDSFSYDIPVKEDGDYVLVLKFSEVYFYAANQKVSK